MNLDELKKSGSIIFECISGSRAYGLENENSDTDIRGVFIAPREQFYGFEFDSQVNDERNNIVYYELGKFMNLLLKNNPTMLELLGMPEDCVLFSHPLFGKLKPEMFLSKLCYDTFSRYALQQVKKARGLNKKVVNPVDKERKTILDFCYVVEGQGSVPLVKFLEARGILQQECGLTAIPHMREVYALYHRQGVKYRGIMLHENSMDVALSSVEKGEQPIAVLSFNKDGYSTWCRDYKEYWNWVKNRNEERYAANIEQGKNYDAKNLMHTFRLMQMAAEIGREQKLLVRRPNRQELLEIRGGKFSYDELMQRAEELNLELAKIYSISGLPDGPDEARVGKLLVEIRQEFYGE